jgi:hypothetical protein
MDARLNDLPALFGRKGDWLGYDSDLLSSLPPERVETYTALEAVAMALAEMETSIKQLQDDIAAHNGAVNEWQDVLQSLRPSFLDLWRENKRTRAHDRLG